MKKGGSQTTFLEPGESDLEMTSNIMMELLLYLKGSCLALLLKLVLGFGWSEFSCTPSIGDGVFLL